MAKIEGDEAVVLHASGTSEHSDARWAQGVEDVGVLTGAQPRGPLEHCLRDLRPVLLRQLLAHLHGVSKAGVGSVRHMLSHLRVVELRLSQIGQGLWQRCRGRRHIGTTQERKHREARIYCNGLRQNGYGISLYFDLYRFFSCGTMFDRLANDGSFWPVDFVL